MFNMKQTAIPTSLPRYHAQSGLRQLNIAPIRTRALKYYASISLARFIEVAKVQEAR